MTFEPEVKPLSYQARNRFFLFVLFLFVVAVPFLIFYAIGYRFHFSEEDGGITRVGGMFVSSDLDDVAMYIDDELVTDMRLFQSAAYIQNLSEGMHKIVVQADGARMWVKNLPVFPHIVTEVQSFNMPATSTVRIVPRMLSDGVATIPSETQILFQDEGVLVLNATTSSSTVAVRSINPEWEYLDELFLATSTTPTNASQNLISLAATSTSSTTLAATSTRILQDISLRETEGEIIASWLGAKEKIPYYFCVRQYDATTTAALYGEHVAAAIFADEATYAPGILVMSENICRTEIQIDHLRQEVIAFDFFPNNPDLVLLHLTDGLYVTEIDDRAWQNVQQIYAGNDFDFVIDGAEIFIKENEFYFELITAPLVN